MALSEHEQRMLDAIEQALFEDDPKFASTVNVSRLRRRRPVLAIALALFGLAALVGGAIIATLVLPQVGIPVAVVGFLAMVAGVAVLVYGVPGRRGMAATTDTSKKVTSPLSSRMEERFRRRFDE
jgi:hypothetical protein